MQTIEVDKVIYNRQEYSSKLASISSVNKTYVRRSNKLRYALLHGKIDAVCSNCGSSDSLEVHHKDKAIYSVSKGGYTYQDAHKTNNELSNGMVLCRSCHKVVHRTNRDRRL